MMVKIQKTSSIIQRKVFIKTFLFGFICVFIFKVVNWIDLTVIDLANKNYRINTASCQISSGNSMNEGNWPSFPQCNETTFSELINDKYIELNEEFTRDKLCLMYDIHEGGGYKIVGKLEQKTYIGHIKDLEKFFIKCNKSLNFHVTLPIIPEVKSKMLFWSDKKFKDINKPSNVLFFGFDTISRAHFVRFLPKTVKLLQEMNFVDFKGFHSLSPKTKVNIAAFTMGFESCLNCFNVFKNNNCTPSLEHYLDECWMIFKDFGKYNYTTLYMENEDYEASPLPVAEPISDFFVQPFFEIVSLIRGKEDVTQSHCVSRESGPQFMLQYNQRFIQKFQHMPIFGFTWFVRPFRDHIFSLVDFDEDFVKFLTFLKSHPNILNNTLIVISGDRGGNRFFNDEFEQALPPLFVRVPEFLQEKFPKMQIQQNLQTNSRRLTSPFDIHHTFLHVLNLQSGFQRGKFQPILPDRSSLFRTIEENRTCTTFHVNDPEYCACNKDQVQRVSSRK